MENKINAYTCSDGHRTVTIDLEKGTTSFLIDCKAENCGKLASSSWYKCDQKLTPEYEWYKPVNLRKLNSQEKEHVKMGGLLLRKIDKEKPKAEILHN